ncbi:hypothetical protein [Henriciella aquimarina]|uniref:hypothetical protein n=1 Tax=Henriciella aquimarina TaxID=545261 RepID=UPI0009FFD58E|nr:hypothetical protein [Henriciella aquimarina]
MKHAAFLCAAALMLTACGNEPGEPVTDEAGDAGEMSTEAGTDEINKVDETEQIAGGACSYEVAMVEAHVVAIDGDTVEMNDSDASIFYMSVDDFETMPEAGEDFTIKREMITEGTCTPEIYTVVDGDVGGVE